MEKENNTIIDDHDDVYEEDDMDEENYFVFLEDYLSKNYEHKGFPTEEDYEELQAELDKIRDHNALMLMRELEREREEEKRKRGIAVEE